MSAQLSRWSRWAVLVGLVVAAGASIASLNWHRTWTSFAHLDVETGRGEVSVLTVESQATFQRWVLVALVSLAVAVTAMAAAWLSGTNAANVVRRAPLEATDR